jgi:outer membrane cobalamin receptor
VRARPNPDLRAERVRGELEGGVTATGVPLGRARLDAGVTAFRADVDGMILWFPDYQFVWSPNNYDVRRAGVEITGAVRLPGPGIEVNGAISDVAATYAGSVLHGQVAYRPRFTARTSLRASLASIDVLAQYRHTGARRTVAGSALNTMPAFGLLDFQFRRPVPIGRWSAELTAAVENLLDRDAAMLVDYPLPGRTWRLGVQLTRGD